MPINPLTTPTQSTFVNTYVPLPQQQLHAAVGNIRNKYDEFVERQDLLERELDQVSYLSNRDDDREFFNNLKSGIRNRLTGLAQDGMLDQKLPQLRAMARQTTSQIRPLQERAQLVQQFREHASEQDWSGAEYERALRNFQNSLPELTNEAIATGQYRGNPRNLAKAVDISEEARAIGREFQALTGEQAIGQIKARAAELRRLGGEDNIRAADSLDAQANRINLQFRNSSNFMLERDTIEHFDPKLLSQTLETLLMSGDSGNYIRDLVRERIAEDPSVSPQEAMDEILALPISGVLGQRARTNIGHEREANFAAREIFKKNLNKEEEPEGNPRRTNFAGVPILGASIKDGIQEARKLEKEGNPTQMHRTRIIISNAIDTYNANNPESKIEDKDAFLEDFIDNDGTTTINISKTGNLDTESVRRNVQFGGVRDVLSSGTGVNREALSLDEGAIELVEQHVRAGDVEIYDEENNLIEDRDVIGNALLNPQGVAVTLPDPLTGNSEVMLTAIDKYEGEDGLTRNTKRDYRIVIKDQQTLNDIISSGLEDSPELLEEMMTARELYNDMGYEYSQSNIPGIETKISGLQNINAAVQVDGVGSVEVTAEDVMETYRQTNDPEIRRALIREVTNNTSLSKADVEHILDYDYNNTKEPTARELRILSEMSNMDTEKPFDFATNNELLDFYKAIRGIR